MILNKNISLDPTFYRMHILGAMKVVEDKFNEISHIQLKEFPCL